MCCLFLLLIFFDYQIPISFLCVFAFLCLCFDPYLICRLFLLYVTVGGKRTPLHAPTWNVKRNYISLSFLVLVRGCASLNITLCIFVPLIFVYIFAE